MLDGGAGAVDSKNIDGWTPLQVAAAAGQTKVMEILVDCGAIFSGAVAVLCGQGMWDK